MRPVAVVTLVRDRQVLARTELGHGAILGRIPSASLAVDDGRVSEAHALVSLRAGALQLLSLRRRFSVDGVVVNEATLRPGLVVELAPGLELHVEEVTLPDSTVGLAWDKGSVPLLHDVARLITEPNVALRWSLDGSAAARLYRVGDAWRLVLPDQAPRPLRLGDSFEAGGVSFEMKEVPLRTGHNRTLGAREPLRLVTYWDTVHIQRHGREPVVLVGRSAQLVSELAMAGVPVGWQALAKTLWREPEDENVLRRRLDAVLRRVRGKLGEGGVREDLVSADGRGHLELRLDAGDRIEDRS